MNTATLSVDMSAFWQGRAPDYASDYRRSPIRQDATAMIAQFGADQAGRFLDLGCGSGQIAEIVLQGAPESEAVLVDSSPAMLATAAELLVDYPKCRFVETSFVDLGKIETASIVWGYSSFALHHVPDGEKGHALAELRRVLIPGGRALIVDEIICEPAFEDEARLFRHMGDLFYPWLSEDELARKFAGFVEYPTTLPVFMRLCEEAGFTISVRMLNGIVAAVYLEAMVSGGRDDAR